MLFVYFKNLFTFYFLAVLGLCCCVGFTLAVASGGCSLVAVPMLLIAVVSLGTRAQLLHSMWDIPGLRIEPVSHALAGGFFTTEPPGKPTFY